MVNDFQGDNDEDAEIHEDGSVDALGDLENYRQTFGGRRIKIYPFFDLYKDTPKELLPKDLRESPSDGREGRHFLIHQNMKLYGQSFMAQIASND